jgi:nucleoside 2-deoxyribosyltransferase
MTIYLAANYASWPQMQKYAAKLEKAGHSVTSEWITGAHQQDNHRDYAEIDLRDVDAADALILFTGDPAGSRTRGGKHVEFGYALAKGKRLFIVGPPMSVFHHLPGIVQRLTLDDLISAL